MRPDVASFSSSTLPSERYLAVMIEGATQHHLPTSWIATGHNLLVDMLPNKGLDYGTCNHVSMICTILRRMLALCVEGRRTVFQQVLDCDSSGNYASSV